MGNLFSRLFDGKKSLIFLGVFFVFSLLIFKDPFSERTLIPNFEPYPDTALYINPALNLVKGEGFNVTREGRIIVISVPPLYSFTLIPTFAINPDPRMAYYTNVVLAFTSLFLFWLILKKLFTNKILTFLLVFLYATNYYIYWVPSIIMAENPTLTLYLAVVFLILSKLTPINSVLAAVSIVAIYAAKYSNVPVSAIALLLYLFKIILEKTSAKKKVIFLFLTFLTFSYISLAVFENVTKDKNPFSQFLSVWDMIYKSVPKDSTSSTANPIASNSWFGIEYIKKNLPFYIKALFGSPSKFLWDYTYLVPSYIGLLGCLGIIGNIFNKKYRFISIALLTFIFCSILFMSTFYTYDARYIYIAIPTLIIGFGLSLQAIQDKIFFRKKIIFSSLIILFFSVYLAMNLIRIKSQVSLNLRYAETPWNYIAVLKMNEYFTPDKIKGDTKPILISALSPFLIDYYSNGNYRLLPLSYDQEFRSFKELVWGPNDYSDLPKLYKKYLNEGYDVYVSRSGLGNESYTNRDFDNIVKVFNTQLVLPGCFDQCNIYSVELREDNGE